jgi:PAS domain S-box-containing protein
MNLFPWLSLCASIICLSLGIIVYLINKKLVPNRIFFLATLASFIYAFTTVMMWTSKDFDNAYFWHKMGTIWPFFVVLVVNFALVFTESTWLKNKLNYLILYLPAVSFWLIDLSTNFINLPPVMEPWGYNDIASGTLFYWVSTFWTAVLPILAFVLCFRFYRRAKDPEQRQRSKFVAVGFAIPIAAFIITNMLLRSFEMNIPNLGIIATFFFSAFVGYGIVKYDLFTFDAALAADNILSTMPDSLILADKKGKILRVNERLVDFTGYTKEELIGQPINKLCAENQKNIFDSIIEELIKRTVIRNHELIFETKNNEKRTILFSGSVVKSKNRRNVGTVCIIHDITEHKNLEERLVKAERLASIGELARQVGHDLRNPLSGIKNSVYILKKKSERLTELERNKILQTMDLAIEDSDRIVTSLVDYSSELQLEPEQCTPKALVSQVLSRVQVPERITVTNNASDGSTVFLDVSKIENVCVSILKNAIEAMPEKGKIEIGSTITNGNLELSFIDSGSGIPEGILSKIFSPLVTTKAKGMGMSLAISKRIVEAHGGKISVESSAGKGTIFAVNLPIKSRAEYIQG